MKSNFIKVFGDTPKNRLWEFLIDSRGIFGFSRTGICNCTNISWNTLKKIFPSFIKEGVVKKTREIGRATMYEVNEGNPKVVFMSALHKAINIVFVRGGELELTVNTMGNTNSSATIDIPESALRPVTSKS